MLKISLVLSVFSLLLQAGNPIEDQAKKDYEVIKAAFDKADRAEFSKISDKKNFVMNCAQGLWTEALNGPTAEFVTYEDTTMVGKNIDPILKETATIRLHHQHGRLLRPNKEGHLQVSQVFLREPFIKETDVFHLRALSVNGEQVWMLRFQAFIEQYEKPWQTLDILCYGNKEAIDPLPSQP